MSGGPVATSWRRSVARTHYFRYVDDRLRTEMAVRPRHAALQGDVTACWGFAEDSLDPLFRRHLPGVTIMLFIGFGVPPLLSHADPPQAFQQPPQAFLGGPQTGALLTRSLPGLRFVMVELSPVAAFTLLGGPLQEIRDTWVDLGELRQKGLRRLPEQLSEIHGWPERFDLVEDALHG